MDDSVVAQAHNRLCNWDVEAIIGSAYPGFGFGEGNSSGRQVYTDEEWLCHILFLARGITSTSPVQRSTGMGVNKY